MDQVHLAIVLLLGACFVKADINMHNPRGSNNRQDEASRGRANANRLFNSQNNNRGGHNVGSFPGAMYYYAGSTLQIQWANQHTCGDQNNFCDIVVQYMCDEDLRDGTTTQRAPVDCDEDCDTNPRFGHHESLTYYEQCASRERNRGLFTANRDGNMGDSAIHTRQNNNGNRHGFECQEERDYYPYFGPSPWKDIVVFTNEVERCNLYKTESQNVKSKWSCTMPDEFWDIVRGHLLNHEDFEVFLFNDKKTCEEVKIPIDGKEYQAIWKEFPSHGLPAPDCLASPWSRDNHQGNTIGGEFLKYDWTIPDIAEDHCTLRIRYNITTGDFERWNTDHTSNFNRATMNLGPEEIYNGFTFNGEDSTSKKIEAFRRHYYLRNNPRLDVFGLRNREKNFRLQMALDTTQYGRTFQDRSHSFAIKPRPSELVGETIHNLNVRGKRGNIVQVYPSVEYDFVPTQLQVSETDYVHIQWTGSDKNPRGNAGQGRARTDRSNLVQLGLRPYAEGDTGTYLTLGTNYPREICDNYLWGESRRNLVSLALSGYAEVGEGPGVDLNGADAYFDLGPTKMIKPGVYHFVSTRNNAFTNRDQKATIDVKPL